MERSSHLNLRFLAEPTHVDHGGRVPGGTIMKWIDQAGQTCAVGWTGDLCATVFVGGVHFLTPVHAGDLVEVRAQVIQSREDRLSVAVDLYAGDPMANTMHRAGHCVAVYGVRDERDQPKPARRWNPGSPVEVALEQYAARHEELRQNLDTEMETRLKWLEQQRPSIVQRTTHA